VQVCSDPTKHETQLHSMDEFRATTFSPVAHPACSQSIAARSGSPHRPVVILPARGSISPVKVATSPKRILSPHVFTSGSGSPLPVCAAYSKCALGDNKHVIAVRNADASDSAGICSAVSKCNISTSHGINSESDERILSTTLHVDGILTRSSENASRRGIVSVACRESRVQETSVLSPLASISRLPTSASDDNLPVSCDNNMTVLPSTGHMYQSSNCASWVTTDKISSTQAKLANCEVSVHHAVTVAHTAPQTTSGTHTVNVTSIRKVQPSADAQKRSVIVKLFAEHSSSPDEQVAEQCLPVNATPCLARSPKRVVLLTSMSPAITSTSGVGSPSALQQSTAYQSCSSLKTVNLITTCAAKAVSVMSSSICRVTASSYSQKVTESMPLLSNGNQTNSVVLVGSSVSSTPTIQMPTENLSDVGTRSEDDSDDDSVVVIDADIESPLPSPSRNSKKRSSAAQNVILLNHHKSSTQHATDSEELSSNAVATDRTGHSRTKRKSVLGTRLLESANDEGIILPVSRRFENGSRRNQPSRRKSFPQRRTDTSVPQLQFCTKQWKRDINYSRSNNASSTYEHLQCELPKDDAVNDLSEKVNSSIKSELLLSQSNSQSCRNIRDRRKRKPMDHCESSELQEVKRSKRSSPVKHGNTLSSRNMESASNLVHKAAAVESLSPESILAVSSGSTDNKTVCRGEMKPTEPAAESSELLLLGKDKRSMEMSVTNEDGVVENLLVTIIDISSSEEDNEDAVEVQSVSSAKLDSPEVSLLEAETSQSVASKSAGSSVGTAVETVPDKSCINSRTLPVSKPSCRTKRVQQKCQQTVQRAPMGRKVLVRQGRASVNDDGVDVTKVKQLYGKSNGHKHSKTDTVTGSVKQLKVDSDSAAAGSFGPVVRLRGSKHRPTSCCIVSGARDVHDETAARSKQKSIMLSSSCYSTSFQLRDCVPWRCVFCHQGSSYRNLGDLFGPYYAKTDDSAKSDSVKCQSSPSKGHGCSVKKSPERGYVLVSQRRRRQLQKYALSVAGKSPRKSPTSPDKGIPPEIWLHEDCAIWTNGICLSPTGQLCGLEAAVTLSLQTVYLFSSKN